MMNTLNLLSIAAAATGLLSGLLYALRRRPLDGLLALVAGLALAGLTGNFSLPGEAGATLSLAAGQPPASLQGVRRLRVDGDGLRAAQWNDLPALPLAWTAPQTPSIRVAFPSRIALGRMFTLSVSRSWQAPGRLQLLAENGETIAEDKGDGLLRVQWLPPLAERLMLRARLLDASGKVVDEGPVPFEVRAPLALRVRGRFGAPSFDLRTLDELLADSDAVIDWQVELGKSLSRTETARTEMQEPDLEIVDAAWFERAGASTRSALLGRVAKGRPLLVLGANAGDAGSWSRSVGLALTPQPADKTVGRELPMASSALAPAAGKSGPWQGEDGIWTRDWQGGRIAWLALGDWHRHAISEPRRLALWWQGVLDRLRVRRAQDLAWLDPDEMPLPGQRLEVCAQGVQGVLGLPDLQQELAWQRRPEHVDAACAALWPRRAGWLRLRASPQAAGAKPEDSAVYVYATGDWPLWQRAQRRDATLRYMARTPTMPQGGTRPLPVWPFGVAFALAVLGLWWRERR